MIKKTYAYHKPSEQGLRIINDLRELFSGLHRHIEDLCPASRERSTALTRLEDAAMWAIKSVVLNDEQAEVELRCSSTDPEIIPDLDQAKQEVLPLDS